MAGNEIQVGMNFSDLAFDDPSRENFRRAMSDRFETERGTSYRICFQRRDTETKVRVLVSAVPEYDTAGHVVASIGFFVDESLDAAAAAIHQAIANAPDCRTLLTEVAVQLRDVVRFDSLLVTRLSRNRRHLRRLFECPPPPEEVSPTKW